MRRAACAAGALGVVLALVACGGGLVTGPPKVADEMALRTFISTRPGEAKAVRARAQISPVYGGDFAGKEGTHYALKLDRPGEAYYLYGYAEKKSAAGEEVYEAVKDGQPHELVLRLQFASPGDSAHVRVLGLVTSP